VYVCVCVFVPPCVLWCELLVMPQLRERRLPGFLNAEVEGLDMDDWMVVDCGDVIVNVMDAGTLSSRVSSSSLGY
jgi:Ribosomal silencing factor during starvation